MNPPVIFIPQSGQQMMELGEQIDADWKKYKTAVQKYMNEHPRDNYFHFDVRKPREIDEGFSPLGWASFIGSIPLIHYFVEEKGVEVLKLPAHRCNWTPLFCAANCLDKKAGYLAAKTLIQLSKSNEQINSLTSTAWGQTFPSGSSPIKAAAEKTKNFNLIRLLLSRGSLVFASIESKEAKALIEKAQQANEKSVIFRLYCHKPQGKVMIPKAIRELVLKYFEEMGFD